MLKVWFMFDNHGFARIEPRDRDGLIKRAAELFARDGCGSLFVRDETDTNLKGFDLHGHPIGHGAWGVKDDELARWAEKVATEESFRHRMHA